MAFMWVLSAGSEGSRCEGDEGAYDRQADFSALMQRLIQTRTRWHDALTACRTTRRCMLTWNT